MQPTEILDLPEASKKKEHFWRSMLKTYLILWSVIVSVALFYTISENWSRISFNTPDRLWEILARFGKRTIVHSLLWSPIFWLVVVLDWFRAAFIGNSKDA